MDKLHAFFNVNFVGGAERSFTTQLMDLKEKLVIQIYKPSYSSDSHNDLNEYLKQLDFKTKSINIDSAYYSLSRSSSKLLVIYRLIQNIFKVRSQLSTFNIPSHEMVYLNGSKIGILVLPILAFSSHRGRIFWHFRDYPNSKFLIFILKLLLRCFHQINLEFVTSSKSVTASLRESLPTNNKIHTVYNPVNSYDKRTLNLQSLTIAHVGMLTPWKGQKVLLNFIKSFYSELKDLGIKEFIFWGEAIYQSDDEKSNSYKSELDSILSEIPKDFVTFAGKDSPENIYKKHDILMHTSLLPEPFGRVLVEAYSAGIPVLSTGLGGSFELVLEPKSDYILPVSRISSNNLDFSERYYKEWFQKLSKVIENMRSNKIHQSALIAHGQNISKLGRRQLLELLGL